MRDTNFGKKPSGNANRVNLWVVFEPKKITVTDTH